MQDSTNFIFPLIDIIKEDTGIDSKKYLEYIKIQMDKVHEELTEAVKELYDNDIEKFTLEMFDFIEATINLIALLNFNDKEISFLTNNLCKKLNDRNWKFKGYARLSIDNIYIDEDSKK